MRKRVLLKLSGEALSGEGGFGFSRSQIQFIAEELKTLYDADYEIAVVLGAGNLIRGRQLAEMHIDRASADYAGMLATVMNALILADTLTNIGIKSQALSLLDVPRVLASYRRAEALKLLETHVLILGGGTGRPYFTTDTSAAQLALELKCDVLLKATKVEGLYTADPKKNMDTKFIKKTSFKQALAAGYEVMDSTAFALCADNHLPVRIFNMQTKGNLLKAAEDKDVGSIIE